MTFVRTILSLLVSALLLCPLAERPCSAQVPPEIAKLRELLKEGDPAYTEKDVAEWTKELTPLVEKAAGRKFKTPPKVRLTDREGVAKALSAELFAQFKVLLADQKEAELRTAAEGTAKGLAVVLLGKFAYSEGEVLMLPRNVAVLLKLTKTDAKFTVPIVRLILAHELTHALQDQEVNLSRTLASPSTIDRRTALNCIIEGQAVVVQERVAKMLGLDDAAVAASRLFAAGTVKLEDPALELVNRQSAAQFEQTYIGGRNFVDFHVKKGGDEMMWKVLTAPPARSSMIGDPATYSTTAAATPDFGKALAGFEKQFGDHKWQTKSMEIGHAMLQAMYNGLEEQSRKQAMAAIAHVHALMARPEGVRAMASVTLFQFKESAPAAATVKALEAMAHRNVENLKKSASLTVEKFALADLPGVKADVARVMLLTIKAPGEPASAQAIIRVIRGKVMVELLLVGLEIPDKRLIEIIDEAFRRAASAGA